MISRAVLSNEVFGIFSTMSTKKLKEILQEAKKLNSSLHDTVTYKGQIFSLDNPPPQPFNKLPEVLYPKMDKLILDKDKLQRDIIRCDTYLAFALNTSKDTQTLLHFLPSQLHELVLNIGYDNPYGKELTKEQVTPMLTKYASVIEILGRRLALRDIHK